MALTKYKKFFTEIFLGVLLVSLVILYLRSQNPLLLPGIEKNILITLIALGLLGFALRFPNKILAIASQKIQRLMHVRVIAPASRLETIVVASAETREQLDAMILNAVFQVLLAAFLSTLLLNEFYPKVVSQWVDLTYFMIIVMIFGAASIWAAPKTAELKQREKAGFKDYVLAVAAGIIGAVIIWFKINGIGWLAYLVSGTGGLLIILMSILLLEDENDENKNAVG